MNNIALIGFNTSGAMGDCFNFYIKYFSEYYPNINWHVFTKKNFEINTKKDINVHEYNYNKNVRIINEVIRLRKDIKKYNFDAIFIMTPNLVFNLVIAKIFHNKIVYLLHDPIPHEGEPFLRKMILKIQNYYVCKKSFRIVVASENIKEMISRRKFYDKTSIIELGILDNLIYDNICIKNKSYDILFFGRLEKYKGLGVLANALRILEKNNIKCNSCIVGRGNIDEKIFDGIDNLVRYNEYVSYRKLADIIDSSKVVVLPYINATGSQTVQISYYYKCPVIASDVGCFVDYIENNKTGFLFKAGDSKELAICIKNLLEMKEYDIGQMRKEINRILNEKFDNYKICSKWINIIN